MIPPAAVLQTAQTAQSPVDPRLLALAEILRNAGALPAPAAPPPGPDLARALLAPRGAAPGGGAP